MTCECPAPGFCRTFGKHQSPRQHAICQRNAEGLTPEQCDVYRTNWLAATVLKSETLPCEHRGPKVESRVQKVERKGCGSCAKRGQEIPVYSCSLFGLCTLKPWQMGQAESVCATCESRPLKAPKPLERKRIEPDLLLPAEFQFNNSIIRYGGKLLMAYRLNWGGARLVLAELDEDYRPVANWKLPLSNGFAQEDPRLFVYQGELHISFSAVKTVAGATATDVCYARLVNDNGWQVAQEFAPVYPDRDHWEKNWGFFEHDGELLCLYSIKMGDVPFRILKIDGERTELVAEHKCDFGHKAGMLHGGAPPVFHRGEYYCFYHRRLGASTEKAYTIDLLTFEGKYPFRPSRHIPAPLLLPNRDDRPGPKVPHAVFPGGAFIDDRFRWCVSFGYYDKWSEAAFWDINQIDSALQPLPGGPMDGIAYRPGTSDLAFVKEVRGWNEYGLPERFEPTDAIVDIGAHIGSFVLAAHDRGAGRIIACEPYPPTFAVLQQNAAGKAECLPVAVGGSRGTLELRNPDTSGTSTVGVTGHVARGDHLGTAEQVTLADVLPAGPVRLLKLDCEGAEYGIIQGADLSSVQEIVGEAHAVEWQGGQATIKTLAAMLEAAGFTVDWHDNANGTWDFKAVR